jgi:hypothetical protein
MKAQLRYLLQDVETHQFMCMGETGDVAFTPWVDVAGHFYDREVANEAGCEHCGPEGFIIFSFFVMEECH